MWQISSRWMCICRVGREDYYPSSLADMDGDMNVIMLLPCRSILGKGKKSKPKKQQPKSLVVQILLLHSVLSIFALPTWRLHGLFPLDMQPEDLSKVVHVKIPTQYLQHGVQTEGKKQPAGTYGPNKNICCIQSHAYIVMHIMLCESP